MPAEPMTLLLRPRNFFDRITKPAILKMFEAIGGMELKSRYAASRKFDLAASAERLFSGQVIVEAEIKDQALAWLQAAMRFGDEVTPDTEIAEVAPETVDDGAENSRPKDPDLSEAA